MTDIFSNIHKNAIGLGFSLYYGWKPYGKNTEFLEKSQWWSLEELIEYQQTQLANIIEHAYQHVPYYRENFKKLGLEPIDIQTQEDLIKLPLLTKRQIQENSTNLLSNNVNHRKLHLDHTGGSTGFPLTFYHDENFIAWSDADKLRNYRMSGYSLGERWAFLWGSDYDSLEHKNNFGKLKDRMIYNTIWINTFDLRNETIRKAAQLLKEWNPKIIIAYVSSAVLLAKYIYEIRIQGISPRSIQTSAEVLTREDRSLIEDVFQCKVFDRYGCREVGNIAHECNFHEGLHILSENNLVEVLNNDNEPVKKGELGKIVVTNLNNYGMPFIRYEIGDMAVLSDKECSCGRGMPLLERVVGRQSDIIYSPSGKLIHGEFFTHLFYKLEGIIQFRIIQETSSDLNIQIVPKEDYNADFTEKFLREIITEQADPDFQIQFEYFDHLEPSKSGKYRFTISKISPISQLNDMEKSISNKFSN
jgi:phenylacetate-CoA ligase